MYLYFIGLSNAYDSVDQTLMWDFLAHFDVPPRILAVIRQFHDGMQAWVWLDDGEGSAKFDVEQGLRQACVLVSLLFNTRLPAVMRVVKKCFFAYAVITDSMVQLKQKKKKKRQEGRFTHRQSRRGGGKEGEEVQRLWGMLYADDASIVSRSSEGLERMMTVIATACSAFRLTVPEAKPGIICLHTKGGGRGRSPSMVPARHTNKLSSLCTLGGAVTADRELSIEKTRRV